MNYSVITLQQIRQIIPTKAIAIKYAIKKGILFNSYSKGFIDQVMLNLILILSFNGLLARKSKQIHIIFLDELLHVKQNNSNEVIQKRKND